MKNVINKTNYLLLQYLTNLINYYFSEFEKRNNIDEILTIITYDNNLIKRFFIDLIYLKNYLKNLEVRL